MVIFVRQVKRFKFFYSIAKGKRFERSFFIGAVCRKLCTAKMIFSSVSLGSTQMSINFAQNRTLFPATLRKSVFGARLYKVCSAKEFTVPSAFAKV